MSQSPLSYHSVPFRDEILSDSFSLNIKQCRFWTIDDVYFMNQALILAEQGAKAGEVPVGAIFVCNNHIIGTGFNQPISQNDPTAHAEIVALRTACYAQNNYRLPANTTIYVTLEPCTMCFGALIHARVSRLVFGAYEPRSGAVGSQLNLSQCPFYNHRIQVEGGLLQSKSQNLLRSFFRHRRR